eukprot:1034808-Prorocentrum_minimum.AAC.1
MRRLSLETPTRPRREPNTHLSGGRGGQIGQLEDLCHALDTEDGTDFRTPAPVKRRRRSSVGYG